MSLLTNSQKALLAKAFVEQNDLTVCIGKSTTWESTDTNFSDQTPPPEMASLTEVRDPIVYKIIDVVRYAKLDPAGTITYRGSTYAVTSDWATAYAEGYTAVYVKAELYQDQIPTDTSFRIVGLYTDTVGVFNSDGVSYPDGVDATYFVSDPGMLSIIDYRKPINRAADQSEIIELIIPF